MKFIFAAELFITDTIDFFLHRIESRVEDSEKKFQVPSKTFKKLLLTFFPGLEIQSSFDCDRLKAEYLMLTFKLEDDRLIDFCHLFFMNKPFMWTFL